MPYFRFFRAKLVSTAKLSPTRLSGVVGIFARPLTSTHSVASCNAKVATSSIVESKKSTFQAHCTTIQSPSDIPLAISHFSQTSSRYKRATHCMYASRTLESGPNSRSASNASGIATTRQDDGGEKGAGDILSNVLERAGAKNVLVVVWRWYGGVPLGGERWRIIGQVAREALREGGFIGSEKQAGEGQQSTTREGKGKKKKR